VNSFEGMMGDWNIGSLGEIKESLKPNIPLFHRSSIPSPQRREK
jgi:hypothetical protein